MNNITLGGFATFEPFYRRFLYSTLDIRCRLKFMSYVYVFLLISLYSCRIDLLVFGLPCLN